MLIAQILAVILFVVMFVLIVLDKIERHIVTLGCGLLTLILVFGLAMRSGSAILETLNVAVSLPPASGIRPGRRNPRPASTGRQSSSSPA